MKRHAPSPRPQKISDAQTPNGGVTPAAELRLASLAVGSLVFFCHLELRVWSFVP